MKSNKEKIMKNIKKTQETSKTITRMKEKKKKKKNTTKEKEEEEEESIEKRRGIIFSSCSE